MKVLKIVRIGATRQTVKVYHENFAMFQPNSHVCGDCAIRSVSGALNIGWHEALDALFPYAHKLEEAPTSTECVGELLKDNGFKWVAIDVKKGGKRPRVFEFAKSHPDGVYVLRVANHLVYAKQGSYFDIWDCGEQSLYGYWEKI